MFDKDNIFVKAFWVVMAVAIIGSMVMFSLFSAAPMF